MDARSRGGDGSFHPTFMVVTPEEGASLQALAVEMAREALPFVRGAARRVQAEYRHVVGLRHLAYDDVSFFLMSDVLLDNQADRRRGATLARGRAGVYGNRRGSASDLSALPAAGLATLLAMPDTTDPVRFSCGAWSMRFANYVTTP